MHQDLKNYICQTLIWFGIKIIKKIISGHIIKMHLAEKKH